MKIISWRCFDTSRLAAGLFISDGFNSDGFNSDGFNQAAVIGSMQTGDAQVTVR